VVRLLGVPFCERCASEQEDYFAIGELTRARQIDIADIPGLGSSDDELLLRALRRARRRLAGRVTEKLRETTKQGAIG
jgi:hypothetical protein